MITIQPNHANHTAVRQQRGASGKASSPAAQDSADVKLIQQLAARDREVRTHEQAHVAAAGGLARGGAKFQFTTGPNGRQYATSGEVSIDVSAVPNDPEATVAKAQKISRAALAPANPSQADRTVAARANALATEAKIEIQRAAREEAAESDANDESVEPSAPPSSSAQSASTAEAPSQAADKNPYEQTHSSTAHFIDLLA